MGDRQEITVGKFASIFLRFGQRGPMLNPKGGEEMKPIRRAIGDDFRYEVGQAVRLRSAALRRQHDPAHGAMPRAADPGEMEVDALPDIHGIMLVITEDHSPVRIHEGNVLPAQNCPRCLGAGRDTRLDVRCRACNGSGLR